MAAELRVDRRDGVVVLTLNRPEARNAMNVAMRDALIAEAHAADEDPDIAVVVVTGTDPAFSAGVDLKEGLAGEPREPTSTNPAAALRAMSTPVIGAVNGACVTGGLEVALSCSFVVASERARFADTHARVGLLPAWGMSALLPRAVGIRMARYMTATGNFVDAATALRAGLVTEVVPHDRLLARALELAGDIASADPGAVGESLALYDQGDDVSLQDALALEVAASREFRFDAESARARFAAAVERGGDRG